MQETNQQSTCYPFSTELRPVDDDVGGWGIFLVNLGHRVHPDQGWPELTRRWRLRRHAEHCQGAFDDYEWVLHPHLSAGPSFYPGERLFAPETVLSPSTYEALLGKTFGPEPRDESELIRRRLDRFDSACSYPEPLLLTLQPSRGNWLRTGLKLMPNSNKERCLGFRIEWADLWLFADHQGLSELGNAMLAFKVTPEGVYAQGRTRDYCLGDLAELHRRLRITTAVERLLVCPADEEGTGTEFWPRLLESWLGITLDRSGRRGVAPSEDQPIAAAASALESNPLLLKIGDPVWADRYSDYAKVLMAARIEAPQGEGAMAWDCPQVTPELSPTRLQQELSDGIWSVEQASWAAAAEAGAPTLGDALLYELASNSSEGSVLGLAGSRRYQVDADYLRDLLDESGIAIWDYWRGLALRDTCAFLAWDDEMPIVEQAESRYYPLYLHAYYSQVRLHDFTEAAIEHELNDLAQARRIGQAFMEFRNQFWFREPAIRFQGIEVAGAMRAGMGLNGLYDSVSSEIGEVGDYVDRKSAAGRQQIIAFLVLLFFPLSFLWDLSLQGWIKGQLTGWSAADLWMGFFGGMLGVGLCLKWCGPALRRQWNRLRGEYFFRDF